MKYDGDITLSSTSLLSLVFVFLCKLGIIPIQSSFLNFVLDPRRNRAYPTLIDWSDNEACFPIGTIEENSILMKSVTSMLETDVGDQMCW